MESNKNQRVYITGDKHGSLRPFFGFAEKKVFGSDDILIITGDAGYVWDDSYLLKIETLEQLFPGTIAFIDGNHENHVLLNAMEVCEWNGGLVHRVGPRTVHLMRGEIYTINDENYFTLGGARTVSRFVEGVEGVDWFLGEEPSDEELSRSRDRLYANADRIDYIITHESPLFARDHIDRPKHIADDYCLPAVLGEWYEYVMEHGALKQWYFGHMHVDQIITPTLRAIHNNFLHIGTEDKIFWA